MRDTHFVLESALKKSSPGPSVVGEGGRGTFATWSGSIETSQAYRWCTCNNQGPTRCCIPLPFTREF